CALDAGGHAVTWLTGVSPEESVGTLSRLVRDAGTEAVTPPSKKARKGKRAKRDDDDFEGDSVGGRALTALAFHAGPAAERALEGFAERGNPMGLRKQAAFWLGNTRGRAGYLALERLVPSDPSPEFRSHGTFAFSQSSEP